MPLTHLFPRRLCLGLRQPSSFHPQQHIRNVSTNPQPLPYRRSSPTSTYSSHTSTSSSQPPRPSKAQLERRILFAIVAAPVAIVTSYVLFQRLVLKVEPKRLVRREDGGLEGDEELMRLEREVGLLGERVRDGGEERRGG